MDISSKNNSIEKTVGNNIKSLRIQAGLTIEGLTFALDISISYTLMIQRGATSISAKLAKRIANFFNIEVSQLYSDKKIILTSPLKIETIYNFYKENENNPKFFIKRRSEYSVAAFIKNHLLSDPFLKEGRDVSQIITYSNEKYGRALTSQELSRELRRLYNKGILRRIDKFGNGTAYKYLINNKAV